MQEQALELSQQMQRLGCQLKQDNAATADKAEQAAMHAQQAEEAIKIAREQSAKTEPMMARETQDKAADSLAWRPKTCRMPPTRCPKKRRSAPPSREAGQSVENAREQMNQARQELERGKPADAGNAMQQAAQSLREASRRIGRPDKSTKNSANGSATPGGNKSSVLEAMRQPAPDPPSRRHVPRQVVGRPARRNQKPNHL